MRKAPISEPPSKLNGYRSQRQPLRAAGIDFTTARAEIQEERKISEMENAMVQDLLQRQRYRHIRGGYGWPTLPNRQTRYPNLVAELGYSAPWLDIMAEFANVSPEIMAAVLEDNEELTFSELQRLARRLGVSCGYLIAPLQVVDPKTNKGRLRLWRLSSLTGARSRRIETIINTLKTGKPVTYAAYRWAMNELQAEVPQRVQHRSHRLTAVR